MTQASKSPSNIKFGHVEMPSTEKQLMVNFKNSRAWKSITTCRIQTRGELLIVLPSNCSSLESRLALGSTFNAHQDSENMEEYAAYLPQQPAALKSMYGMPAQKGCVG
ncbi:hypothetical protein L1049_008405 [Liquidambar formosana]|uniref:Uncharacterized protein n=1 Tax=Liquidambar formosana TaxID=63359 RepID=A0AAP0S3H3_LIQFO